MPCAYPIARTYNTSPHSSWRCRQAGGIFLPKQALKSTQNYRNWFALDQIEPASDGLALGATRQSRMKAPRPAVTPGLL